MIVKSGTDFQNLSEIVLRKSRYHDELADCPPIMDDTEVEIGRAYQYQFKKFEATVIAHNVTKDVVPDQETEAMIEESDLKMKDKMRKVG